MSDDQTQVPENDDEVEGHLLKEALAAGAVAGAIFAGSAQAQVPPGEGGASAGSRVPSYVVDPGAGGTGAKVEPGPGGGVGNKVEPGPSGGTGSKVEPGPSGGTGGKVEPGPSGGRGGKVDAGPSGGKGAKAKAAKPAKKRGGR